MITLSYSSKINGYLCHQRVSPPLKKTPWYFIRGKCCPSSRVWQPSADSDGLLAHHYCQQWAVTPDPESLNSNKKGSQTAITICRGLSCHTRLDGQHCPLIIYQGVFSRVEKPSDDINSRLFLMNKKGLKHLSPDHGGREFESLVEQNWVHKLKVEDPRGDIGDPDVICLAMADVTLL